jgi:Fe-S metabolism associated domain
MQILNLITSILALTDISMAFTAPAVRDSSLFYQSHVSWIKNPSQTRLFSTETSLPLELSKLTNAFRSVGDDSLRHKQLLYMAGQLPKMDPKKMVPENKVPGCLSTVYIDGSTRWDEEKGDYVIDFVGDSDGLLTKGLVALLVR